MSNTNNSIAYSWIAYLLNAYLLIAYLLIVIAEDDDDKAKAEQSDKANAEKAKYDYYMKYAQSMKEQAEIRLQG